MQSRNVRKPDSRAFSAFLAWKPVACSALLIACAATSAFAQKGGSSGGGGAHGSSPAPRSAPTYSGGIYRDPTLSPTTTQPAITNIEPLPKPTVNEDERCLPWDISEGQDTAVAVKRLKVPSNARSEFQKACDANNKQKYDLAEQHARKAIDKFQDYSAAWVMLGVSLEEQHKAQDARDACAHAMTVDSKYVPAYLCKAEFSTRDQQWDQVLNVANMAAGLNTAGDSYANYYRATAFYYMDNLDDAKKSALQAAENDVKRNQASLHFLLARIYEAQGDRTEAIAELHQILKQHNSKQDEDTLKQYLTKLESQEATK